MRDPGSYVFFKKKTSLTFVCVVFYPYTAAIICKFRISGQTCVCANRIYVHSSVYDEFASRLAEKVAEFKVGNGLEEGM